MARLIYRLRGTPAAYVGYVEAADERSALQKAIEEFGITDPQHQKRLFCRKLRRGRAWPRPSQKEGRGRCGVSQLLVGRFRNPTEAIRLEMNAAPEPVESFASDVIQNSRNTRGGEQRIVEGRIERFLTPEKPKRKPEQKRRRRSAW